MGKIDKLVKDLMDAAIRDESVPYKRIVVIRLSERSLGKVLTPARMELMRLVGERKPASVNELAGLAKRSKESVSRDLRILDDYGFLEFVNFGRTKKPEMTKDLIMIPLRA
ncbi:MAG: hypothetical protein ABII09_00600 [Planctomycetota bacterium]